MIRIFLGLGSNLGDKRGNIQRAVELMEDQVGALVCLSSLIETEPWGFRSDNGFVNGVACFDTELSPLDLLHTTQGIERQMGRTEKSVNGEYHDRIIDIDILLYGDEKIDTPELTVPHPLMEERDFVMVPLREIMERKVPTSFDHSTNS